MVSTPQCFTPRAALEGGVVVAIHGMRPGATVTLSLLRRLAWTAVGISGMDLLGRIFADSALSHLPVLKQLANALASPGLTALRLERLAGVAARACSPTEPPRSRPLKVEDPYPSGEGRLL